MQVQIRYDRLVADIDRVLVYDNVPPAERESDYRYWRAVGLARLALELSNGNDALTLDGMPVHFTRHYADARRTAQSISRGQWTYQTRGREEEIAAMINHEFRPEQQLQPALIIAHKRHHAATKPDYMGMPDCVRIGGHMTDIDQYSQEFLEDYFQIDLNNIKNNS